jgi:hypothetical protein
VSLTALLVELLIIGFGGLLWIALGIVVVWGDDWINLAMLGDWSATVTLFLIATAYIVGLLLDSFCATIFDPFERRIRDKACTEEEVCAHADILRLYVMTISEELSKYFEGRYNRSRLLRATALSSVLSAFFAFVLAVQSSGFSWRLLIFSLAAVGLIAWVSLRTWKRYVRRYYKSLEDIWILRGRPGLTSPLERPT